MARLSIVDVDIHWSSWRHEAFGLAIYDDSTIPNHSINLRSQVPAPPPPPPEEADDLLDLMDNA